MLKSDGVEDMKLQILCAKVILGIDRMVCKMFTGFDKEFQIRFINFYSIRTSLRCLKLCRNNLTAIKLIKILRF